MSSPVKKIAEIDLRGRGVFGVRDAVFDAGAQEIRRRGKKPSGLTRFEVADLYETSVCPLCRVMRRELKKRGVARLKVVYSREEPARREEVPGTQEDSTKRETPGSLAFVPSVAGLILASEVVRDLTRGLLPGERD